jgi:Tfp pilus assembly protein PilF
MSCENEDIPDQDKLKLYKSGMIKFTLQDFAGALKDFELALETGPQYANVLQSIAHVYEKLGDYDAALEYGRKAVEHNPGDFLAHTSLSMFYQRKGMITEAEAEKARAAGLSQTP